MLDAGQRRGLPGSALAATVLGFRAVTLDAVVVTVTLPSILADLGGEGRVAMGGRRLYPDVCCTVTDSWVGERPRRCPSRVLDRNGGVRAGFDPRITEGTGLVVTRDGRVIVMRSGDTVWTPPGEEHWHGAVADGFMTHLALWEGDDVTWLEHVTDDDYHRAQPTSEL